MSYETKTLFQFNIMELLAEIGRGSYAVVWRARCPPDGRQIAVKELSLVNVPRKRVERVLQEIAAMQKLNGHPHIVQLLHVETHGDALLLGMELCEGGTLREMLDARGGGEAPGGIADRDEVLRIARGIARGLQGLRSANLVHRDLKPSNVLFSCAAAAATPQCPQRVLLADFGMSRHMTDVDTSTRVCGTIRYMAPEMLTQKSYGASVDLWSLGLIVYEICARRHPFLEWSDESSFEDVTDAMAKLLQNVAQRRDPTTGLTEMEMPSGTPFQFFCGEDSPVRIVQGLLQETPRARWGFDKLFEVLGITESSPSAAATGAANGSAAVSKRGVAPAPTSPARAVPGSSLRRPTRQHQPAAPQRGAQRGAQRRRRSHAQRRRLIRRRQSAAMPDRCVRSLLAACPIGQVPLGRDSLVVLRADDSCLEALRVLLAHRISSAPVVRVEDQVALGFVDVLDLVTLVMQMEKTPTQSVLDALVTPLVDALNFSGNNPYKRLEVSEHRTVADALTLLIGGVKRLAVTDGARGVVSVLTQSQLLRWIVSKLDTGDGAGGDGDDDGDLGLSAIRQKLAMSVESLGMAGQAGDDAVREMLVIQADATVASAFLLLANNHLSAAPVVDKQGAIVGVFSASDVVRLLHSGGGNGDGSSAGTTGEAGGEALAGRSAAERVVSAFGSAERMRLPVMRYLRRQGKVNDGASGGAASAVVTVQASDTVATVCSLLAEHHIHRCYVVSGGARDGGAPRPTGVVSIADVLHLIISRRAIFDAAQSVGARRRLRGRIVQSLPRGLPHMRAVGGGNGGALYVDDAKHPRAHVHVVGTRLRRGMHEICLQAFSTHTGEDVEVRARAVQVLADWAVRATMADVPPVNGEDGEPRPMRPVCVMWAGLEQALWPAVARAMQMHGLCRESIEPCGMFTLQPAVRAVHPAWQVHDRSQPPGRGAYTFGPLRACDASRVNAAWKFRSESSLSKIQAIVATGHTMAAFEPAVGGSEAGEGKGGAENRTPVAWVVTYENGSVGMLYTADAHRRRGLATEICRRLVEAHHPAPFLFIEAGNHASQRLFEGKLGFERVANVAWVRWVKRPPGSENGVAGDISSGGGASKTAAPSTPAAAAAPPPPKPKRFRPKGGLALNEANNSAKWEAWYGSEDLPPWDTNGAPCFALRALVNGMGPRFQADYPRVCDLGCGTGSNALWLSAQGCRRVVGLDLSPLALDKARSRLLPPASDSANRAEAAGTVEFVEADIFRVPQTHPSFKAAFDCLVDVQVFHAIYQLGAPRVVANMAWMLRKRGLALVVTGNDREEVGEEGGGCGPAKLKQADLLEFFTAEGLFTVVEIREARFDPTPAYGDIPPLCWVALFLRTSIPC